MPSTLKQPWRISAEKEKDVVMIGQQILKDLRRQDILAIDFLYQSYKTKLKGVILNEENDMNAKLQVSSFLGALGKSFSKQFLVLILTPDEFLAPWHYHLTEHGGLKVHVITPETRSEEFFEETNVALILSFSNLKLARCLAEYELFSVVIDSFDIVVQKMAIRKLEGEFKIGLTTRNFYTEPDQKLHWTILNWANPGVFGKLADFYEIDNDNFANFRNSYKTWWFRINWNFCESLKPYTQKETDEYQNIIKNWKRTNLQGLDIVNNNENARKQKRISRKDNKDHDTINKKERDFKSSDKLPNTDGEIKNESAIAYEKVFYKSKGRKPLNKIQYGVKIRDTKKIEKPDIKEEYSDSSGDTIIYEDNTNSRYDSISNNSENLVFTDETDLIPVEEISHELVHAKSEEINQKSDPVSLANEFSPSEPAKKRRRTNKGKEIVSKKVLDTSTSQNKCKDSKNTKEIEPDELLLRFLPNITSKKVEDKVFDFILESESSQKLVQSQNFICDRRNSNLDAIADSDGEAESFLRSLVGIKVDSNKDVQNSSFELVNGECNISGRTGNLQTNKRNIDKKKLEDLLKETENY